MDAQIYVENLGLGGRPHTMMLRGNSWLFAQKSVFVGTVSDAGDVPRAGCIVWKTLWPLYYILALEGFFNKATSESRDRMLHWDASPSPRDIVREDKTNWQQSKGWLPRYWSGEKKLPRTIRYSFCALFMVL